MQYTKFKDALGDWGEKLRPFIESEDMDVIYAKLKEDGKEGRIICPSSINTFRAFEKCPFKELRVVIMGMEPYYQYNYKTKIHTADGMAFSCSITDRPQPSLSKLYEAIEDDVYGGIDLHHIKDNDLSYLAEQGVLLLNSSLTVEANKIGSHAELWYPFMRYLITEVINVYTMGTIYIMMGQDAQNFTQYVTPFNHWIFETEHPSFANRQHRMMKHNRVFSQVNKILKDCNESEIQWLKSVKDENT